MFKDDENENSRKNMGGMGPRNTQALALAAQAAEGRIKELIRTRDISYKMLMQTIFQVLTHSGMHRLLEHELEARMDLLDKKAQPPVTQEEHRARLDLILHYEEQGIAEARRAVDDPEGLISDLTQEAMEALFRKAAALTEGTTDEEVLELLRNLPADTLPQ